MFGCFGNARCGPMGIDLGSRSVKLVQLTADQTQVWEAARWDLASDPEGDPAQRDAEVLQALTQAREGHNFRGRDAVVCLGASDLVVQNVRVAPASGEELHRLVRAEVAGRMALADEQTELRYLEAADVRQGEAVRREVIVLASRRATLERIVALADRARLRLLAIDVAPTAMLRCYTRQFRREADLQQSLMFVNLGASSTAVVIARGMESVFIKYLDLGGRHLDEAVARHLKLAPAEALRLRRHNGERRSDHQDPEVLRSVQESIRPVLERLACELSLCLRYYSVTFRGQPLTRIVLSGGEATSLLAQWLGQRLDLACELGDPLRSYQKATVPGRAGQWDVATGLALHSP